MSGKDIALTVGGVLATMVVAYLIYVRQQTDAANAVAANQAAVDATAQAAQDAQYSNEYQYSNSMPSFSVPSISGNTSSIAPEVDTSSNTTTSDSTASTDQNNLLSQIISTFADSINASPTSNSNAASMIIPTVINSNGNSSLANIPVTAQDALNESGVQPGSTIPVSSTTSTDHNSASPLPSTVHFDHILNIGAQ